MRTIPRLSLLLIDTTLVLPGTASANVAWGPQRVIKDWSWSTGSTLVVTGSGASLTIYQLCGLRRRRTKACSSPPATIEDSRGRR